MDDRKMKIENNRKLYACICQYCGKEFWVPKYRANCAKYCSKKCADDVRKLRVKVKCAYCGKEKEVTEYGYYVKNTTGLFFCNSKCQGKYKTSNNNFTERLCEVCGKIFVVPPNSTQRFCSIMCQGAWQSKFRVGENSANFNQNVTIEDRTLVCEWCGGNYMVKPYKIETSRFCSIECRQGWFSEVYSQSEEWKEKSRLRAVKILEDGLVENTLTEPQVIINDMLDSMNIEHENEKGFKYFAVDNFLKEHNLIIEVMGTFWHCDHRNYPEINYKIQLNRIRSDKSKNKYIANNYGINILYLWETDILGNMDVCKNLILLYVKNEGLLSNYHSFNYTYDENGLRLNDNIALPYMDWNKRDIRNIIDIRLKGKISRKQDDKWITFKCEVCGKEKEELISHYNKKKHHYCSVGCRGVGQQDRVDMVCPYCGKSFFKKKRDYNRSKDKIFYCSRDCRTKHNRENYDVVVDDNGYVEFNCDYCGKTNRRKIGDYNKSKDHFCDGDCYGKWVSNNCLPNT